MKKKKSTQVATDTRNNRRHFIHTFVNLYAKGAALLIGITAKIYKWQRLELSHIDNLKNPSAGNSPSLQKYANNLDINEKQAAGLSPGTGGHS